MTMMTMTNKFVKTRFPSVVLVRVISWILPLCRQKNDPRNHTNQHETGATYRSEVEFEF
jgi:hypothetical protein